MSLEGAILNLTAKIEELTEVMRPTKSKVAKAVADAADVVEDDDDMVPAKKQKAATQKKKRVRRTKAQIAEDERKAAEADDNEDDDEDDDGVDFGIDDEDDDDIDIDDEEPATIKEVKEAISATMAGHTDVDDGKRAVVAAFKVIETEKTGKIRQPGAIPESKRRAFIDALEA